MFALLALGVRLGAEFVDVEGCWDLLCLYTLHCTLYTVHCTLFTIHCTSYTIHTKPFTYIPHHEPITQN